MPAATTWSATLSGATQFSSADSITCTVPNGTYSFGIGTVAGYNSTPSTGTVTVAGANLSQTVAFGQTGGTKGSTEGRHSSDSRKREDTF